MTTQTQDFSRRPALCRLLRGHIHILAAGLLIFGSSQVSAKQGVQALPANDPLEFALLTPVGDPAMHDALPLPGRSAMYSADIRSIFNAGAVMGGNSPVAYGPSEGPIKTMLKRALALLGTPYRWGGTSPEGGFDCSGLVGYVFRNSLGIELPRVSRDMANVGELIRDPKALTEGDLVFFSRRGRHVDHVGIYIGKGQFVHAPRTGKDVEVANLATGYWSQKFFQARRVATQ